MQLPNGIDYTVDGKHMNFASNVNKQMVSKIANVSHNISLIHSSMSDNAISLIKVALN